jgi:hypothetical protein
MAAPSQKHAESWDRNPSWWGLHCRPREQNSNEQTCKAQKQCPDPEQVTELGKYQGLAEWVGVIDES